MGKLGEICREITFQLSLKGPEELEGEARCFWQKKSQKQRPRGMLGCVLSRKQSQVGSLHQEHRALLGHGVEGKEDTVTGDSAPEFTFCRVRSTLSAVKREILTPDGSRRFLLLCVIGSVSQAQEEPSSQWKKLDCIDTEDVASAVQAPTGLPYWG